MKMVQRFTKYICSEGKAIEAECELWTVPAAASTGAGQAEGVCVQAPCPTAAGLLGATTTAVVELLAVPHVGLGHEGRAPRHGHRPGDLLGPEERV